MTNATTFESGSVQWGTDNFHVTDLSFSKKINKIDGSDTSTAKGATDWIYTKQDYSFSFDMFLDGSLPLGTNKDTKVVFDGYQASGSAAFESFDVTGKKGDIQKVKVNGSFSGAVVEL